MVARQTAKLVLSILLTLTILGSSRAALIPPFFIDSVVALGNLQPVLGADGRPVLGPDGKPKLQWFTEGTGFIYGYLIKNDPDPTKRQYDTFLVTAKHVVAPHLDARTDISIRINQASERGTSSTYDIPTAAAASGNFTWFFPSDPTIDLAVLPANVPLLESQGMQVAWFPSDLAAADKKKLNEIGASAGDPIFVLGFPMNLAGAQKNYVVVRRGAIARIQEPLDGASSTFMIDAFVFPGNSGGPVILAPEEFAIGGTKSNNKAYLLGVVLSYSDYSDVAISQQTHRPRVVFDENSGLAEVLPVDYINSTIADWLSRNPLPQALKQKQGNH